jgi:low affinity Fe/Cu permease
MMGWALGLLFSTAILLLIFSFIQNRQMEKSQQRRLDTMYLGVMEEIYKLQTQLKTIELDEAITAQAVGITANERAMLREMIDLLKRGYSIESISEKANMPISDTEQLLAPFMMKEERGKMVNDS